MRRLLRLEGGGAFLALAGGLAVVDAALLVAVAALLAHVVVGAFLGHRVEGVSLALLPFVFGGRGLVRWLDEMSGQARAARVRTRLRLDLCMRILDLGPAWLAGERRGELATVLTDGVEALDAFYARYLPQLLRAVAGPAVILAWVLPRDWMSAAIMVATLPLVPIFMALIGLAARDRTDRRWRALAILGGHFLDVLRGLPTLRVFGRAEAQEATIARVTDQHRIATMSALRVAFLSGLVLELAATLSTALVAVAIGLRLVEGGITLETGLAVLVLTPEVYLPLRRLGAQYHAAMEALPPATRILTLLETQPERMPAPAPTPRPTPPKRGSSDSQESGDFAGPKAPIPVNRGMGGAAPEATPTVPVEPTPTEAPSSPSALTPPRSGSEMGASAPTATSDATLTSRIRPLPADPTLPVPALASLHGAPDSQESGDFGGPEAPIPVNRGEGGVAPVASDVTPSGSAGSAPAGPLPASPAIASLQGGPDSQESGDFGGPEAPIPVNRGEVGVAPVASDVVPSGSAGSTPAEPFPASPALASPRGSPDSQESGDFEGPNAPIPVNRGVGGLVVDLRRDVIRFCGVRLVWAGRGVVLDRVELVVRPGERVALVGASGAGKSTLLHLLLGFVSPDAGQITIGGVALPDTSVESLRAQIGWVPQRPYLFDGTVADNVLLGDPDASPAAIARALAAAGLDLPPDTPVGEGGTRLSAGQRQRTALARALVRRAPLLLLDEPTAHLDDHAQEAFARHVRDLDGATVIMAVHNLRLAAACDRVFELARGRLRELVA